MYSTNQKIIIEWPIYAKHYSICWGYSSRQNGPNVSLGMKATFVWGTDTMHLVGDTY